MHIKVQSQLVEGRLLKLFTTGFWSKLWLLISKSPQETEAEGEGLSRSCLTLGDTDAAAYEMQCFQSS